MSKKLLFGIQNQQHQDICQIHLLPSVNTINLEKAPKGREQIPAFSVMFHIVNRQYYSWFLRKIKGKKKVNITMNKKKMLKTQISGGMGNALSDR